MQKITLNSVLPVLVILCTAINIAALEHKKPDVVVQLGHSGDVTSVTFSKNGKLIISGGMDKTIKLWDAATGRLIRTLQYDMLINNVAVSPDGKYIASASSDNTVMIWDFATGQALKKLTGHIYSVNSVAFSPDGTLLVTGGDDETIKLWDVATGYVITTLQGHSGKVFSVAFSPDGRYIATGSTDRTIKLWDVVTRKEIKTLKGHTHSVVHVVFSTDGKTLASGSADKTIKLWDTQTWRETLSLRGHGNTVLSVAFSPGKLLASGSLDKTIKLWNVATGKLIKSIHGHSDRVESVCFSPDGKVLVSGSYDKNIKLWDAVTGREVRVIQGYEKVAIKSVAFSPDGKYVASVNWDKAIELWDVTAARKARTLYVSKSYLHCVTFSPDGKYIATGGGSFYDQDFTIKLLDAITGKEIKTLQGHSNIINSIAFSPDGKLLASGSDDDTIKLWEIATDREIKTFKGHNYDVESVAFSPDGKLLASGSDDKTIKLWEIATGREIRTLEAKSFVKSVAFSPDGKYIAAGSMDNFIEIWETSSGKKIKSIKSHILGTNSLLFSPDAKIFASCSDDETIKLWDFARGEEITTLQGHSGYVKSIAFSPNGTIIASGSWDGMIKLWNSATGELIVTLISFNDGEWIALTPDGYYTASKGAFNNIHYVIGQKVFTFDQFDLQYNRPDIILQRIGNSSSELIRAYRMAYEKRLRKMGFDPNNFENERSFNVPEVIMPPSAKLYEETVQPTYLLSCLAGDKLYKIERLFIEVNGVPLYGLKGKMLFKNAANTISINEPIPLSRGINIIKVSVLNEKGVESLAERIEVFYNPPKHGKPNLHIIAIGVSKFKNPEYNLTYAEKDADDIISVFSSSKGRYSSIRVHKLINETATRENVLALRSELEKTLVDDHVLVFVATHGLLDDELDYYLAMHDINFSKPWQGGLRYDELEALLDGIPARNKLVLIDACHSGEVDKEEFIASRVALSPEIKSRGFKIAQKKSAISLQSSFELMKELFADLRRNNGAVVISAASGKEYAFESAQWKNGVFTYCVLEGLKTNRSDQNNDNIVTVSEVRNYVSRRVQELTGGKQNPTSRTENIVNDFRVW